MMDISFEINGRKVSPRNMGDALESAMLPNQLAQLDAQHMAKGPKSRSKAGSWTP
ncbi:hypothetical protein ACVBEJ_12635 [Porticoccus sp. GXU_MW_L64]